MLVVVRGSCPLSYNSVEDLQQQPQVSTEQHGPNQYWQWNHNVYWLLMSVCLSVCLSALLLAQKKVVDEQMIMEQAVFWLRCWAPPQDFFSRVSPHPVFPFPFSPWPSFGIWSWLEDQPLEGAQCQPCTMSIPTQRAAFVTSYFQSSKSLDFLLLFLRLGSLPGGGPASLSSFPVVHLLPLLTVTQQEAKYLHSQIVSLNLILQTSCTVKKKPAVFNTNTKRAKSKKNLNFTDFLG